MQYLFCIIVKVYFFAKIDTVKSFIVSSMCLHVQKLGQNIHFSKSLVHFTKLIKKKQKKTSVISVSLDTLRNGHTGKI